MRNKTTSGILFDIKEFAVHDGPGVRMTVFLKGCPLRCAWCHNPEGISPQPKTACDPNTSEQRTVGWDMTADALAERIGSQADLLRDMKGGVTFSGGEPLMQADFLHAVLDRLSNIHILLDTCGHAQPDVFASVVKRCSMVYYDLKLMDRNAHIQYCGVPNDLILENFNQLDELGVPYVVRVPLAPGLTDTWDNLATIAEACRNQKSLPEIDLLPYNKMAGGKYKSAGRDFVPTWPEQQPVKYRNELFEKFGLKVNCHE
jgi:pyruvate formate lyase activating enzyme